MPTTLLVEITEWNRDAPARRLACSGHGTCGLPGKGIGREFAPLDPPGLILKYLTIPTIDGGAKAGHFSHTPLAGLQHPISLSTQASFNNPMRDAGLGFANPGPTSARLSRLLEKTHPVLFQFRSREAP